MAYQLREGVHWCVCDGRVVFLDLLADSYLSLPPGADAAFLRLVGGELDDDDLERLRALVLRGMLVENLGPPVLPSTAQVEAASEDFSEQSCARAKARDVLRALVHQCLWSWKLRSRGLATTIEASRQLRMRAACSRGSSGARLLSVLAGFHAASLLLPPAERCLVRALALRAICCRMGIRPTLVFGVRMNPFQAHCWLQLSGKVLIGDFEQVRLFTPVMALE
ncbi:MAG: lasso peptide biosynthesis B2 protein [Bacillota bacterium]